MPLAVLCRVAVKEADYIDDVYCNLQFHEQRTTSTSIFSLHLLTQTMLYGHSLTVAVVYSDVSMISTVVVDEDMKMI